MEERSAEQVAKDVAAQEVEWLRRIDIWLRLPVEVARVMWNLDPELEPRVISLMRITYANNKTLQDMMLLLEAQAAQFTFKDLMEVEESLNE